MAAPTPAFGDLTNVQNPYEVLTERQRYQVVPPTEPWSNQYALIVARDSIQHMEQFLQQTGHLRRWTEADVQLTGWRPQQIWEGTSKLKARIPVLLLFSQLQSLLPNVLQAIFPLHDNIDVAPRPGSTFQNARAAFDLIMAQLDSLGEDGITRFRDVARECFEQAFLYGNGIIEISWLYKIIDRLFYEVNWEAERRWVQDQFTGRQIMAPVGPPQRVVKEIRRQITLNQPNIQCIDIRDFLIDPNCRVPNIQAARMCATRHFPTVGEILSLMGQPGFMVPPAEFLIKMTEERPITPSDQAKQQSASMWGHPWNLQEDYSTDPMQRRLECCRWFSRERNVWLLNRKWVLFNWANPYGVLPFLNAFYVPYPNRFHGMALSDATEGDQHVIASLLEARMNELALAINAPFVRKQGAMISNPGQIAMSPSKVIDVNDEPDKAIKRLDVQAQTQNITIEVNDAYARSARTTGLSDLAILGVPQAGGNSANRTATGVDRQAAAASVRIQYLVENAETSLLEPMCTILHQFNVKFLPRNMLIDILGADDHGRPQMKQIDPVQILNAMPRFTVRAGAKLRQRNMLAQMLPWFVQTLLNPELIQIMGSQYHKKLSLPNLMELIIFAIDMPKIALWDDMTPEEVQALSQPPAEAMLEMQKQRERLQAMAEMQQDKDEGQLANTMMGKMMTPRAAETMLGFEDVQHITAQAHARKAMQRPRSVQ